MTSRATFRATRIRLVVVTVSALLALAVTPAVAGKKKAARRAAAQQEQSPELRGPRHTVAVGPVAAKSDFVYHYGSTSVSGGLSAMLTTALVEADRFIVVERNHLSAALTEQELTGSGWLNEESAPPIGELVGAQWMVLLSVTEFAEEAKSNGFGIGSAGAGGLGGGLAPRTRVGIVGLDVRVIDTATVETVAAFHVREKIKARSVAIRVDIDDISLSQDHASKTPIGKAARKAIEEVVRRFVELVDQEEWSGSVVDFDGRDVAINAGSRAGIAVGDSFLVERASKTLTDPNTGRVLGSRRREIGQVFVEEVDDNVAFGTFVPAGGIQPRRGDLVSLRKIGP